MAAATSAAGPPQPLYAFVPFIAPAGAAEVQGDKGRLTQLIGELPAPFRSHHSLIFHIALVADQENLSVVPRVRLNLRCPVSREKNMMFIYLNTSEYK